MRKRQATREYFERRHTALIAEHRTAPKFSCSHRALYPVFHVEGHIMSYACSDCAFTVETD